MKLESKLSLFVFAIGVAACSPQPGSNSEDGDSGNSTVTVEKPIHNGDDHRFRDADTNELSHDDNLVGVVGATRHYLIGPNVLWPNAVVKWKYNSSGQPSAMKTEKVLEALIETTQRWEKVCGIRFQYEGTTTAVADLDSCDGETVVGWGVLEGDTIGVAQDCYRGNRITELDLILDRDQIKSLTTMQMTATHEFGHALGMGHTEMTPAVMTPILTTGFPVDDDIATCQSLYGAAKIPVDSKTEKPSVKPTEKPTVAPQAPAPTPKSNLPPVPTLKPVPKPTPAPAPAPITVVAPKPAPTTTTTTTTTTLPVPVVVPKPVVIQKVAPVKAQRDVKVKLKSIGNLCLDRTRKTSNGLESLTVSDCSQGKDKRFDYKSDATLRAHGTTLCLEVYTADKTNYVVLNTCDSKKTAQKWILDSKTGGLQNAAAAQCLTASVSGSSPLMVVQACQPRANQLWEMISGK